MRKHSIFNEWLEQLGFSVHEGTSIREVKEALLSEFSLRTILANRVANSD